MSRFTHSTDLPHRRQEVFDWHELPGAFTRLTPPALAAVVSEPSDGLRVGSRAKLRLQPAALLGVVGTGWTARHTDYQSGVGFTDVMERGPMAHWQHRHTFSDAIEDGESGCLIRDEVDYALLPQSLGPVADKAPQVGRLSESLVNKQLEGMFGFRERILIGDLALHARLAANPLKIVISGATGLVGTQLSALLTTGGHTVVRLTRSPRPGSDDIGWDPAEGRLDPDDLRGADAVVHLAGHPIIGRFTEAHKQKVLRSRTEGTRLLAQALAELGEDAPRTLVCASASGFYGPDREDEVLNEESPSGEGFLAEVCREWERAADPAREAGIRVVSMRTGLVLSPAGGLLQVQLPLFAAGLGGRLGDGKQWMPWIGIDDAISGYAHALFTDSVRGPVNLSAPNPVRGSEFAKELAAVLHRPALVPVPGFAPSAVLGREATEEFVLAGQRMDPQALRSTGFEFRNDQLDGALHHLLCR